MPIGDCLIKRPGAREGFGASQPLHRVIAQGLLSLQGTQLQLPGNIQCVLTVIISHTAF